MDVSLIIATRDRCQRLVRCLDAVRLITFDRSWELIIVDNGSIDETASVVRDFIDNANITATYAFEPRRGKSHALNTALGIARGQILAFTDDDCYPTPDILRRAWLAFDDPSVGYLMGRVLLHDPTDLPISIIDSAIPFTFPGRSFVPVGSVAGANMAFRKQVLLDIGGFDPLLGPGSSLNAAEDVDAVARASAMNWKGRYCPDVVVRHHHGRKASDAPRLLKSYGIGAGAYHMKLLLRGGELLWFARSVYQIRRRYRFGGGFIIWEWVGAARYTRVWLKQILHSWNIVLT